MAAILIKFGGEVVKKLATATAATAGTAATGTVVTGTVTAKALLLKAAAAAALANPVVLVAGATLGVGYLIKKYS